MFAEELSWLLDVLVCTWEKVYQDARGRLSVPVHLAFGFSEPLWLEAEKHSGSEESSRFPVELRRFDGRVYEVIAVAHFYGTPQSPFREVEM